MPAAFARDLFLTLVLLRLWFPGAAGAAAGNLRKTLFLQAIADVEKPLRGGRLRMPGSPCRHAAGRKQRLQLGQTLWKIVKCRRNQAAVSSAQVPWCDKDPSSFIFGAMRTLNPLQHLGFSGRSRKTVFPTCSGNPYPGSSFNRSTALRTLTRLPGGDCGDRRGLKSLQGADPDALLRHRRPLLQLIARRASSAAAFP